MYIFISHASVNFDVAEEICNLIEKSGRQCFLAPRDIRSGYEYAEEIMGGIERSDVMLLLLSKQANSSPHVLREVERAVSKRIPIIVYKLEEVELSKSMEYFLMSHQWVSAKPGVGHEEIVRCVERFGEREGLSPSTEEVTVSAAKKRRPGKLLWIGVLCVAVLALLVGGYAFLQKRRENKQPDAELVQSDKVTNPEELPDAMLPENTPQVSVVQVRLGDTIEFGSYNDEPIEWRVLKLAEDGGKAVVVSKHILTMKAFDAAESGSYNYYNGKDYWGVDISGEEETLQHQLRGNNDWALSNIRTWLNSTAENVVYEDQAPAIVAMSEYKNGYDTEPGFLSNFSEEEQAAILVTDVETNGNITQDKVYLLSSKELQWFEEADVGLAAMPTEAALEQDNSNWYEVYVSGYSVEDYFWWLRDYAEDGEDATDYKAYLVSFSYTGNKIISESVGGEGFGIRPAMTLDLTVDCIKVK